MSFGLSDMESTYQREHAGAMTLDEIFDAHLSLITTDLTRWLELFADGAVVEFPYATSVGFPARLEGRAALRKHFEEVIAKMSFGKFTFSNVRRYPGADPGAGWFEVHGEARSRDGGTYAQDYVMRLETKDGRITRYVEYWNMVPVQMQIAKAMAQS